MQHSENTLKEAKLFPGLLWKNETLISCEGKKNHQYYGPILNRKQTFWHPCNLKSHQLTTRRPKKERKRGNILPINGKRNPNSWGKKQPAYASMHQDLRFDIKKTNFFLYPHLKSVEL